MYARRQGFRRFYPTPVRRRNIRRRIRAAVAFVQSDKNFTNSGSSCVKAFPSNNGAGNMLIACVGVWKSTAFADPTITDTKGNTWLMLLSTPRQFASGQSCAYLFVAYNCASGPNTVTVSVGSTSDIDIAIHEYSGCATVTARDQIASGSLASSSNILTGTFQTQFNNEVILSFAYDQTHGTQTFTPSAGWTARQQTANSAGASLSSYDRIASATGSFTNTIAISGGSSNGIHGIIASFADTTTTDPLVQTAKNAVTGTSLAVVFPQNNVAGHVLFLAIGRWVTSTLGTITSVTDSQGNVWNLIRSTTIVSISGHGQSQLHLYACASCAAGANTVTIVTSSSQDLNIIVHEYPANTIDGSVFNSAPPSGTTPVVTIASGNLLVDAGLAFAVAFNQSSNAGQYSDVNGTGWRQRVNNAASGETLSTFDQIVASSSTLEQTITVIPNSFGLHDIVAAKAQSLRPLMEFLIS